MNRPSDRPILVYRCVCTGSEFATASAIAARTGAVTVAELQESMTIATGCGLCIPYVQRTLETGLTGHPILVDAEVRHYMERSGIVLDEDRTGGEAE